MCYSSLRSLAAFPLFCAFLIAPAAAVPALAPPPLPVHFETNVGQAAPDTRLLARGPNFVIDLQSTSVQLQLGSREQQQRLTLQFVGANPGAQLIPLDLLESTTNYLIGSRPSEWITHVPNYARARYAALYPGIDAIFYSRAGALEHDFIVAPGADYRQIRMRLPKGAKLSSLSNGALQISLEHGNLEFQQPVIYQQAASGRKQIGGRFWLLPDNEIGFQVDEYDPSLPLIIDPVLSYSTFLANLSLYVFSVATDAEGATYVAGLSFDDTYPTTSGAYQTTCASCQDWPDVFITKLSPDGSTQVFSTFLGGDNYDQPFGLRVDANGNVVVAGYTESTNFPTKNSVPFGQPANGLQYGFLTSLSPDGSSLNYSSLLGGSSDFTSPGTLVSALALDSAGNAYISGNTQSPFFPLTPGALDLVAPSTSGVFVSKFSPDGKLSYGALIGNPEPQNGGGGLIGVTGIAVDSAGSAYVTGAAGTLWPVTPGAFQSTIFGDLPYAAPFVSKISPDATSLVYSTFVGDGGAPSAIVVDSKGRAIIAGNYAGSNFTTTSNAFERTLPQYGTPAYIAKLNLTGSKLAYSTYFYGNGSNWQTNILSLAVDSSDRMWIAGSTNDPELPLQHPLQSVVGTAQFGSLTGFVSQFNAGGTALNFSTFFGGPSEGTQIVGLAIDPAGKVHIGGFANYDLFTTPGAYLEHVTPPPPFYDYTYGFAAAIDPKTNSASVCLPYPNNQGIYFPFVAVGTSASQSLTITNCGSAPLSINSITASDAVYTVPAKFNGCQQPLPENASCTFTVRFTPTAEASYPAAVNISSNASIPLTAVALQGNGALPHIQVLQQFVTFDPLFVGQSSIPQPVFVENAGLVPLRLDLSKTSISAGFSFDASRCKPRLYSGDFCIFYLTFAPPAAGEYSGTFSIASNDPSFPQFDVGLTGSAVSVYPVPQISALNPPAAAIGSNSLDLQVQGTNFFAGSIVRINGVAQKTTYQGSYSLSARLNTSLFKEMRQLRVTVLNPTPGGGESLAVLLTVYRAVPVSAAAMVYEPFRRLLYATVPASAAASANSVISINPITGATGAPIAVGNDPRALALSDDGQYLYVGLDGDHSIQRINLHTRKIDRTFVLPTDEFGQLRAFQMKTVPGSPQLLVASFFRVATSPAEAGIALFNDSGLVNWLPNDYQDGYVSVDDFAIAGTPPVVYASGSLFPSTFFSIFTIDTQGIHAQPVVSNTTQYRAFEVETDGHLLYTDWGQVWDPVAHSLLGTYNAPSGFFQVSSVLPETSLNRTFYLNTFSDYNQYTAVSVDAYDQQSFSLVGSTPFLNFYGPDVIALNRWGRNGFAFVVGDFIQTQGSGQVIIFRSNIADVIKGQAPVPQVTAAIPSQITAGGGNFVLSVQGTGFVRGSVVRFNGQPRTTTFVSDTQLTADIPASAVAAPGMARVRVSNPAPGGGLSSAVTVQITQ